MDFLRVVIERFTFNYTNCIDFKKVVDNVVRDVLRKRMDHKDYYGNQAKLTSITKNHKAAK